MTSGLTIPPLPPIATRREPEAHAAPAPHATAQARAAGTPNPTLRLDPALGLVVMQFHSGEQTESIPTQQQLDAYRSGAAHPPGSGRGTAAAATTGAATAAGGQPGGGSG